MVPGVGETKGQADVLYLTCLKSQKHFTAALLRYVDLPLSVESIERCDDSAITDGVDIFVHTWEGI